MRVSLLLSLFLLGPAFAEMPTLRPEQVPVRVLGETDTQRTLRKSYERKLEQPIDVNFQETPLDETIATIAKMIEVPMRIDETALEEEGIQLDEPITLKLHQHPSGSVLRFFLNPLDIVTICDANGAVITTSVAAGDGSRYGEIRTYDLSAILKFRANITRQRESLLPNLDRTWLPPPGEPVREPIEDPLLLRITQLIRSHGGFNWEPNVYTGSEEFSLSVTGHMLIVRQSPPVHAEIQEMLEVLAETLAGESRLSVIDGFPDNEERAEKLQSHLNELVNIDADEEQLIDVIRQLEKPERFSVWLDAQSWEEEGIQRDEPITLSLQNVTRGEALRILLDRVGLAVVPRRGVLVIASEVAAEDWRYLETAVISLKSLSPSVAHQFPRLVQQLLPNDENWGDTYSDKFLLPFCDDILVVRASAAELRQVRDLLAMLEQVSPRTEESTKNDTQPETDPVLLREYLFSCNDAAEQMERELPETVQPDTWNARGKTIMRDENVLSVWQTEAVHLAIRKRLHTLEREKRSPCIKDPREAPAAQGGGGGYF